MQNLAARLRRPELPSSVPPPAPPTATDEDAAAGEPEPRGISAMATLLFHAAVSDRPVTHAQPGAGPNLGELLKNMPESSLMTGWLRLSKSKSKAMQDDPPQKSARTDKRPLTSAPVNQQPLKSAPIIQQPLKSSPIGDGAPAAPPPSVRQSAPYILPSQIILLPAGREHVRSTTGGSMLHSWPNFGVSMPDLGWLRSWPVSLIQAPPARRPVVSGTLRTQYPSTFDAKSLDV